MRFEKLKNEDNIRITEVNITLPYKCSQFDYFYPDGYKKFLSRKIYMVRDRLIDKYYETVEEAIEYNSNKSFIDSGFIYRYGIVEFSVGPVTNEIYFRTIPELYEILDISEKKLGLLLNSYVCLEDKNFLTLYEYKTKIFGEISN